MQAYRCSCQHGETMCDRPAVKVCGIKFGHWWAGLWFCAECAEEFERALPNFYDKDGKQVMGGRSIFLLERDGELFDLEDMRDGPTPGQAPRRGFTCDGCGLPIIRRDGQWVHANPETGVVVDGGHQAIPG